MAQNPINFDELASKYGGVDAVQTDYDALAKKFGGTDVETSTAPTFSDRAKRVAGLGIRSVGPQAVGAIAGAAMGAPIAGVGAVPGAIAGAGAMTIAQLIGRMSGANAIDALIDKLGIPRPETLPEKIATDVTGAMTGTASQLGLARNIASQASPIVQTTGQRIADILSQQPGRQLAATAMGQTAGTITREKGGTPTEQFAAQIAAGSLPFLPQIAARPISPETSRLRETAAMGKNIGMVIPPADVNPTITNRFLEWIGGGKQVHRDVASMRNASIATNAVKHDLGIPESEALTISRLNQIRNTASQAYNTIENAGPFRTDNAFAYDIARLSSPNQRVMQQAPSAGSRMVRDIADEIGGLQSRTLDGRTVIELTKRLRELATTSFRNGDTGDGRFYRGASDAIENLVARTLGNNRQLDVLRNFQDARTTIAKTYAAEAALNDANATINPRALAQQFDRGNPLSGNMSIIGRFSNAFPAATRPEAPIGHPNLMSQFDVGVGAGGLGLGYAIGHPELALLSLTRPVVRGFSMSPMTLGGQNLLASPPSNVNNLEALLRATQPQLQMR